MAKILLIDDDADMITACRMTLEHAGHEVFSANSPTQGLAMLQSCQPELIVLDVIMETQTDGIDFALKLRDQNPDSEYAAFKDIPILMLTAIHGATPLQYEPDIEHLPVELFVDKPIDPDDLIKKVSWILNLETIQ